MLRIEREKLLNLLESVRPGLSAREIIDQSSCIIFNNKRIQTFNGEVACSARSPLKMTGAVQAAPLLDILGKLTDEVIEVEIVEGKFLIKCKQEDVWVRTENEVLLPIDKVEKPGEWIPLHEEFSEAVRLTHQCAGKDETEFANTCVHIHPKWVEAFDTYQFARYRLKTGVEESVLVRSTSIKHIASLDMTQMSVTGAWLHFKNASGLIVSCMRCLEEYTDLSPILKAERGHPMNLPKGLVQAAERADVFSSDTQQEENLISISLKPGRLKLEGIGISGGYRRRRKIAYKGEPLSFMISPELLIEITKKHNEVLITQDHMRVDSPSWHLVICLSQPESEDSSNGEEINEQEEQEE